MPMRTLMFGSSGNQDPLQKNGCTVSLRSRKCLFSGNRCSVFQNTCYFIEVIRLSVNDCLPLCH